MNFLYAPVSTTHWYCSRNKLLVILFFYLSLNVLHAEGTKQLDPNSTDVTMLLTNTSGYGLFGAYNGASENRLNIHISNPNDELVYIGLHAPAFSDGSTGAPDYYFRIVDPAGQVVYGPTLITSATANLNSWADATAGPLPIKAGGYVPFTFNPAGMTAGDYRIEFSNQPGTAVSTDRIYIKHFDITVANKVSNTEILGRIWSQNWAFRTPTISGTDFYDRPFNGKLYSYSTDRFVTEIDFNNSGFKGLSFNVALNFTGVQNTDNIEVDRRSVENQNKTYPLYKIFLNNPELSSYPSGVIGNIANDPIVNTCDVNDMCIQVEVTQLGQVEILLDFDQGSGVGNYDLNTTDVLLTAIVIPKEGESSPYSRCIAWDGKNGAGANVNVNSNIPVSLIYSQGVNHYAVYDVEYLSGGLTVNQVRPTPLAGFTQKLYFDDSNIPDATGDSSPQTSFLGCTPKCHTWSNYAFGNLNTINTWWFSSQDVRSNVNFPACTPQANDDTAVTSTGVSVEIDVVNNDFGDFLDPSTVNVQTPPRNGTVNVNVTNGRITYTPNDGFHGIETFEYEICDASIPALCEDAIVTVTVNGIEPVNDDNNTLINTAVTGNVLTNDLDFEEHPITLNTTPTTLPRNGTVALTATGSYTYTPNSGFLGIDEFEYEICDNFNPAACEKAVVTIEVTGPPAYTNNGIIANRDDNRTTVNIPVTGNVRTNDHEPDGDITTVNTSPITNPTNGTVVLNADGSYVYTPNEGFMGSDSFEYEICDDGAPIACSTANVKIDVVPLPNGGNAFPFAGDDFVLTLHDLAVSDNLLGNDSDRDTIHINPITNPVHGTVTIAANGDYTYTPATNYVGPDQFIYRICKGPLCVNATAYILVLPEDNDTQPYDDDNSTFVGIPVSGNVLTNDNDLEGHTISFTGFRDPNNAGNFLSNTSITTLAGVDQAGNAVADAGDLTFLTDGSYTFTPSNNFMGMVKVDYKICDNGVPQACKTAMLMITVDGPNPVNNTIIANDDENLTLQDLPVSGNMLVNDDDPEGNNLTVSTSPISNPSNGTVSITNAGVYTYQPNAGFVGTDQFDYEVCDDGNEKVCDTVTVLIEVLPTTAINNTTFAGDDFGMTEINTNYNGNLLTNDRDPESNTITINQTLIQDPAHGTVTISANGDYLYEPDNGYTGTDQFIYEICDNGSPVACVKATAYLLIVDECNTKTLYLTDPASSTVANAYCTYDNWTYYYDPLDPGRTIFAIEHLPGTPGSNSNAFEVEVTIDVTSNPKDKDNTSDGIHMAESTGKDEVLFAMGRHWNVDLTSGNLNGWVNIKFFYDTDEYLAIDDASKAWLAANNGSGKLSLSNLIWFKTVGQTYDPSTDLSPTTVNTAIELTAAATGRENGISYVQFDRVNSFSGGTGAVRGGANPALPIELTGFRGKAEDCANKLTWETAVEKNSHYFEIERSYDNGPFLTLDRVEASGNTNYKSFYRFVDERIETATQYYRLKMVDLDGSFSFSDVIAITSSCDGEESTIRLYPNPIGTEILKGEFYAPRAYESVAIKIVDMTGKVLRKIPTSVEAGVNFFQLGVEDLSPGSYMIFVGNEHWTATPQKLVKIDY